jgi:hypothetical protein
LVELACGTLVRHRDRKSSGTAQRIEQSGLPFLLRTKGWCQEKTPAAAVIPEVRQGGETENLRGEVLHPCSARTWGRIILHGVKGCRAHPLSLPAGCQSHTHCDNQKCLQVLPHVFWRIKPSCLRTGSLD